MRKLSFAILFLGLGMFTVVGCGDAGVDEGGPVNTGAGGDSDPAQDPTSDAGVGTDPGLMDPNFSEADGDPNAE
jgi:hypothetical protein